MNPNAFTLVDYGSRERNKNAALQTQGLEAPTGAITSSTLNPGPSIQYETPKEPPVYPVAGLNAQQTPDMQLTQPETQAQDLGSQLMALNQRLTGESQARQEEEAKFGIPQLTQTQNDLSSRLKALQNEALAIPLQLQQQAQGRGITTGGLQPHQTAALRNNAIQALSTNSLLEASRGNLSTAMAMADRAVSQRFDPIREQIAATQKNLELILNSPAYSLADKNRAMKQQELQEAKKRALDKQEADAKDIYNLGLQAARFGADPVTLENIRNAQSPEEALSYASESLGQEFAMQVQQQKFENDFKQMQFAEQRRQNNIENSFRERSLALDQAKLTYQQSMDSGNAALAAGTSDLMQILAPQNKLGQGTRTNITNSLGVINAAQDLAKGRQDGKFAGLHPLGGMADYLSSKDALKNRGYLDAINLKVQQWASGASLTEQQIQQVNRFVPKRTDTDRVVKNKLNNLTNFMNQQIKSAVQSEGFNYEPPEVDLFAPPQSLAEIFKK